MKIKKMNKNGSIFFPIIALTIAISFGVVWWYVILEPIIPDDYLTVEGKVVDVEIILRDRGDIDYLILTFDSNEIVKVYISNEYRSITFMTVLFFLHEKNVG